MSELNKQNERQALSHLYDKCKFLKNRNDFLQIPSHLQKIIEPMLLVRIKNYENSEFYKHLDTGLGDLINIAIKAEFDTKERLEEITKLKAYASNYNKILSEKNEWSKVKSSLEKKITGLEEKCKIFEAELIDLETKFSKQLENQSLEYRLKEDQLREHIEHLEKICSQVQPIARAEYKEITFDEVFDRLYDPAAIPHYSSLPFLILKTGIHLCVYSRHVGNNTVSKEIFAWGTAEKLIITG
jgi:chromosome segregation ATPase